MQKNTFCKTSGTSGTPQKTATNFWHMLQVGWNDVLYLAFLYLDVDGDGFLSADDLSVHLPGRQRNKITNEIAWNRRLDRCFRNYVLIFFGQIVLNKKDGTLSYKNLSEYLFFS